MSPDAETIEQARNGSALARTAIVQSLEAPLFTLSMRLLSNRADAEDATQEALLKILGHLDSFRGESAFTTWAHAVAARSILDFRRGAYRKEVVSFDAFSADLQDGLDLEAPDRPEDVLTVGEVLVGCARALLLCLDGEHRLAYVVGQVMDLSGPDGAEICGITPEAFRKRLSRARHLVEVALEKNCGVVSASASCQCHRRLARTKKLGRAGTPTPCGSIDAGRLREVVGQMQSLSERVAAYSAADPGELVPPELAEKLRTLS
jgi:RNA polymerase sigma factor (sigma-70 family)